MSISGAGTGDFPANISNEDKLKVTYGIINYKHYDAFGYIDEGAAVTNMYGDSTKGDYISTNSDNLLMISSPDAEVTALYKYNGTYTIPKEAIIW